MLKHLDFELREPSGPEDYKRWSPKTGLLPVLDLNGEHIPDSTEILLKLDAVYPDPPLLSPDPRVASQQRQLENWADENLLYHFNRYRRMQSEQSIDGGDNETRRGVLARGLRRVRAWFAAGGTWERSETAILRSLGDRMDDLLNFLGTRPFFYSNEPSIADLAVYAMLVAVQQEMIPGSISLVSRRPTLIEFMRRVEAKTEA